MVTGSWAGEAADAAFADHRSGIAPNPEGEALAM
jgi:hypothetical protein